MDNWYIPITLLPSVGFFIVASTSVSNALSLEIARLIEQQREVERMTIEKKIEQLRLVNSALVSLYASGVFLAIAGLFGGLQYAIMLHLEALIEVLICIGIGCTIIALILLMVYSIRAIRIKENQLKRKW